MAKDDKTMKEMLREPLPKEAIKQREQQGMTFDFLEGWWAIQNANRIFGEDGWSDHIVSDSITHTKLPNTKSGKEQGCFRMVVEVEATVDGVRTSHDGVGSCVYAGANNFEMGLKGAETDALKRALRKFGKQFGNELYTKEEEGDDKATAPATPAKPTEEVNPDDIPF